MTKKFDIKYIKETSISKLTNKVNFDKMGELKEVSDVFTIKLTTLESTVSLYIERNLN